MNYTHISVYDQYCWQHGENVAGKIGGVWLKNYCPECNMDNYTHIEEQIAALEHRGYFDPFLDNVADTMTDMLAAVRAADDAVAYLTKELSKHDGWQQFDFFPEPYDLFWYYQQQKALDKLEQ